jgi:hypothetical protein
MTAAGLGMTDGGPALNVLALNSGSSSLKFGLYCVGHSQAEALLSGEAEFGDKSAMAPLVPILWAPEAVPRIVFTKPVVSSTSMASACKVLTPAPC